VTSGLHREQRLEISPRYEFGASTAIQSVQQEQPLELRGLEERCSIVPHDGPDRILIALEDLALLPLVALNDKSMPSGLLCRAFLRDGRRQNEQERDA